MRNQLSIQALVTPYLDLSKIADAGQYLKKRREFIRFCELQGAPVFLVERCSQRRQCWQARYELAACRERVFSSADVLALVNNLRPFYQWLRGSPNFKGFPPTHGAGNRSGVFHLLTEEKAVEQIEFAIAAWEQKFTTEKGKI